MSVLSQSIKRLSIKNIQRLKGCEKITMLTAYDVMTAGLLDQAGVEMLLVGDSLGNVVYGFDSTLPVTMDMMLAHCGAVVRGSRRSLVVADMPFMSYQASMEDGLRNAGRFLKESSVQAVKLEGAGVHVLQLVNRMVESGIPVMGHIGLTPQAVNQMGGYYTHGVKPETARRILNEAKSLEEAGCFSLVLECVENNLAELISTQLDIPTIGIGSGDACDGQVLVVNDLIGYTIGSPSFATPLCDVKELVGRAAKDYVKQTKLALAMNRAQVEKRR